MNRGDILTKSMAIAKRNGFDISNDFFTDIPVESWIAENQNLYFSLIFCHDFAMCFFGVDLIEVDDYSEDAEDIDLLNYEEPIGLMMANRGNIRIPVWQYHLLQMTLCSDPLIYLHKFVQDHEQAELN